MHCSNCGKIISDDAKFCAYCGSTQKKSGSNKIKGQRTANINRKENNRNQVIWLFVLAPFLAVLLTILATLMAPKDATTETQDNIRHNTEGTAETHYLDETFELAGAAYTFTDTFADEEVTFSDGGCTFAVMSVPDYNDFIAGANGLVENRTDEYLDLSELEASIKCTNNEDERRIKGVPKFYIKPSDAVFSIGQEIYTLSPGERAYVYIFTTPPEGYRAIEITMEVHGRYSGEGDTHTVVVDLE